jgi:hypothetical protein
MMRGYIIFFVGAATIAAIPAMAAEANPQTTVVAVSPLAAQPLDQLSATRDRPLFSPTRRPPTPPPFVIAAPLPPAPPPVVTLLGVVMDGEEARAIIRAGPAASVMRVRIGDDVDGWKVGQIESQRLVLLLDDRTATFTIFSRVNSNRPTDAGAPMQSPAEQGAHTAARTSPASNGPTTSSPETAHVRRPHLPQQ